MPDINVNPEDFNENIEHLFAEPSTADTLPNQKMEIPIANNIINSETPSDISAFLIYLMQQKDTEIANLSQQVNQMKKQKKSTIYKIFCRDNFLYLNQGNEYNFTPICPNFLTFSVWVTIENVTKFERLLVLGIQNDQILFLSQKEAENDSILKKLLSFGIRVEVDGVSDAKLSKALKSFLFEEAEKISEIFIPEKAGWDLRKQHFFCIKSKELLESLLKIKCPSHPILSRKLSDNRNLQEISYPFQTKMLQNVLWEFALFGAVSHSLLVNAGIRKFFGIWIYNDINAQIFKQNFLKIWVSSLSEGNAENIRELKELFRNSKDELVFIQDDTQSKRAKNNIEKILRCLTTGSEFYGISITSIPVFITKDYSLFQQRNIVVFPLLFRENENFGEVNVSCELVSSYLNWCENNFSQINGLLKIIDTTKNSPFRNLFTKIDTPKDLPFGNLFTKVETLIIAYCYFNDFNTFNLEKFYSLLYKKEQKYNKLVQNVMYYNFRSSIEIVRDHLIDAYNKRKLKIKCIEHVLEQKELQDAIIYDRSFCTYIAISTLQKLLADEWDSAIIKNIIHELVEEDMLETERNGSGRKRADIKASIPRGCGRNQNRFYKFKAGVLLNESGFLIGTEPRVSEENNLLLGVDEYGYGVYYPYTNAINPHMAITGISGSGKTSLTYNLVYQLCQHGIPCLLLDYSRSFNKTMINSELTDVINITDFPINPFCCRKFEDSIETIDDCALRGMELLEKVFGLKDDDSALILDAIYEILKSNAMPTFDSIYEKVKNKIPEKGSKLNQLKRFCNKGIFASNAQDWNTFFDGDAKLKLVTMDELSTDSSILLTNILFMDLIDLQIKSMNIKHQIMLWLDEIQNLSLAEETVLKLLKEMRKFNLGVIAISQAFHNMSQNMQAALQQATLKLYFRQDGRGARQFAKDEDTEAEKRRLSKDIKSLSRGDFYAFGDFTDINGDICNAQRRKVFHIQEF